MKTLIKVVAVISLLAFIFGCDKKPAQKVEEQPKGPLKKFEFLLDWQAEPTYLGFYYAKEKGYFSQLGLDVDIIQSWGASQAVSSVAAGRYKIATASGGAMILAHNNNANIISLAVLYPRIPTVVYGLAKSGIQNPKDLEGKKIGIYPSSVTKNEFDAFVKTNNLDPKKLNIVSLSGADIPLLKAGQVDAVLHYTEMSPVAVSLDNQVAEVKGKRVFEIHLADKGVDSYGLNIVTSRETYSKDPKFYNDITKAAVKGYEDGCRNQDDAVAVFLKVFPDKDPQYVKKSWALVCGMVGNTPGAQTADGWDKTINLYRSLNLMNITLSAKDVLP